MHTLPLQAKFAALAASAGLASAMFVPTLAPASANAQPTLASASPTAQAYTANAPAPWKDTQRKFFWKKDCVNAGYEGVLQRHWREYKCVSGDWARYYKLFVR